MKKIRATQKRHARKAGFLPGSGQFYAHELGFLYGVLTMVTMIDDLQKKKASAEEMEAMTASALEELRDGFLSMIEPRRPEDSDLKAAIGLAAADNSPYPVQ